jgi:hypothetical protein
VRFEVLHYPFLSTGTLVAKSHSAQIVVNGGEWDRVHAQGLFRGQRDVYVARKTAVPSLMVLSDGSLVIDHRDRSNVRQAISGLRYIIQNGEIKDICMIRMTRSMKWLQQSKAIPGPSTA